MSPTPALTERMIAGDHEQVVFVADRHSGLRAIIAVHSTALGPSLGGIRFWRYAREEDAVTDVLALAQAMTLKAAAAGLHQGGGKAAVLCDDPSRPRDLPLLRALGRAIDDLGGRYIAAEDVGATPADMAGIARETPWVTGLDTPGGSGDPSPFTARGVVHAMRAALHALDGAPDLRGRRVNVQGAGHVGAHLVRFLTDAGVSVGVADIDTARADALARRCGADVLGAASVIGAPCDVFAPCALGGAIDDASVERLRCRVVAGAANNQLTTPSVGEALAARGILYVPDFVANAGGIINIAEEMVGYDARRAEEKVAEIEETTARVLTEAEAARVTPVEAAETAARRRIAEEGAGRRFQPGDAAAWTDGLPLRAVRPPPGVPAAGDAARRAAREGSQT